MSTTLHRSYTVKPGHESKFLEALKPVFQEITTNPKCFYFNVFIASNEPGLIKVVEIWDGDIQYITETLNAEIWYRSFQDMIATVCTSPCRIDILSSVEGFRYFKT